MVLCFACGDGCLGSEQEEEEEKKKKKKKKKEKKKKQEVSLCLPPEPWRAGGRERGNEGRQGCLGAVRGVCFAAWAGAWQGGRERGSEGAREVLALGGWVGRG